MRDGQWGARAAVLGFALGGFFDGILLHQILQWHHLLSLVPEVSSLRLQVLWDGYFHALMYLVAAVGLWGLWSARGALMEARVAQVAGAVLVGFGLWHVLDGVLSHWVLGIHRIKLDSPDPLIWDLVWLFAFGLLPLFVGSLLLRRKTGSPPVRPATLIVLLGLITTGAGYWALQPPPGQADLTTVVFRMDAGPDAALKAMAATDARLVWADPGMSVVVFSVEPARKWSFYRHGAMLVSGSGLPAGCFNWSRV